MCAHLKYCSQSWQPQQLQQTQMMCHSSPGNHCQMPQLSRAPQDSSPEIGDITSPESESIVESRV